MGRADEASLRGAVRRGHGNASADSGGKRRHVLARWQDGRLHTDRARIPDMEAVQGRPRAGGLDLRPRESQCPADHKQCGDRQPAGVGRRQDLLQLGPGLDTEPLRVRHVDRRDHQSHRSRHLGRAVAERRSRSDRLRGWRLHLALRPRLEREHARSDSCLWRLQESPPPLRKRRRRRPEWIDLPHGSPCRLLGPRRHLYRSGRKG